MGSVKAVIGAQYGDEGKGKIVDLLSAGSDYVARFNGSGNAGHCVEMDDGQRMKFHIIPAGAMSGRAQCCITAGMVVNPVSLLEEVQAIRSFGIENPILVDGEVNVVTPYHVRADRDSEASLGGAKLMTTGTGNGPAYADKSSRRGLKLRELAHSEEYVAKRLSQSLSYYVYPSAISVARFLKNAYDGINDLLADVGKILNIAIDLGYAVTFAGAHGTLLDIDHGDYPYVTSSSCTVSGIGSSGVSATRVNDVIGCVKAYTTRSGLGPMIEMDQELALHIQKKANEFGTTTGRRRRIGWIDPLKLEKAARLNQFTSIAVTMLDILSGVQSIYFGDSAPIPGWEEDISDIRSFQDLPENAKAYIDLLERATSATAKIISVGPKRSQTIWR